MQRLLFAVFVAAFTATVPIVAQQRAITADDYARAERFMFDLATGKLKHRITTGEGNVTQLLRIDEKTRTLIFQGVGKEKGRDPYFTHLYCIGMDGSNQVLLTPEDANHEISLHGVKARDGQTDLYGLMYQPTNLDRSRKYFVRHLLGVEPPKEYRMRSGS
jgi:hypothetical protein